MKTKKEYNINDAVWIAGISKPNKLIEGRIVKVFHITYSTYDPTVKYYVIEIPTSIDPLLEVRTWETISQDNLGPVGGIRDIMQNHADSKNVTRMGFIIEDDLEYEPSEDEILAAIEKSKSIAEHQPLIMKEHKPKRKFYNRKKKS